MTGCDLSIMPSYYCAQQCAHCYLGHLRDNVERLDLNVLDHRLQELITVKTINSISLYGGELSLLDCGYLRELFDLVGNRASCFVDVCTNLSRKNIIQLCYDHNFGITVPYNEERPDYKRLSHIVPEIDCTLGVVVLPSIYNSDVIQLIDMYDNLEKDVLFYQYYPSIYNGNAYAFDNKIYTEFMLRFLDCYYKTPRNFKLLNVEHWKDFSYNSHENGFVYITPSGKFATTVYDDHQYESFVEFNSTTQWLNHCNHYHKIKTMKCVQCTVANKCLAEHFVVGGDYCSGLKKIIHFLEMKERL